MNNAFLIMLAGEFHPDYDSAKTYLDKLSTSPDWGDWAQFYLETAKLIAAEFKQATSQDPALLSPV